MSVLIENLSKSISRLPGMGPRIAKRIVLHLANNKDKALAQLIDNLHQLKDNVHNCEVCGNLDEGRTCAICLSPNRDESLLCVIEEVADLWAIERTKNYRGKYHVLGGNLSAMLGKSPEDLNLKTLFNRVAEGNFVEVIIATSATMDGQNTAHFIAENLKEFPVKVTRLANGVPMGSELDYLDEGTISIAFKTRTNF